MAKTVAIVQSSYIPWKGHFDLINASDEFIFLEHAQYVKRSWRNRNRIKTAQGVQWLTLPVKVKGRYHQRIDEVEFANDEWGRVHFETLRHAYGSAPYFSDYEALLGKFYSPSSWHKLSDLNVAFAKDICDVLGIQTRLSLSTDYRVVDGADECLLSLTQQAGGDCYLSGPTAKGRLDEQIFRDAGVDIRYFDYSDYPTYDQVHPPFEHAVTVLDLLFCTGPDAPKYMKTLQ